MKAVMEIFAWLVLSAFVALVLTPTEWLKEKSLPIPRPTPLPVLVSRQSDTLAPRVILR